MTLRTNLPENKQSSIPCPDCHVNPPKLIVKTNSQNDSQFLGCPNFPNCQHTRPIPESWIMEANGQPRLFR